MNISETKATQPIHVCSDKLGKVNIIQKVYLRAYARLILYFTPFSLYIIFLYMGGPSHPSHPPKILNTIAREPSLGWISKLIKVNFKFKLITFPWFYRYLKSNLTNRDYYFIHR